ncbi:unnamed protein product, partial [marine sediment metagenome]
MAEPTRESAWDLFREPYQQIWDEAYSRGKQDESSNAYIHSQKLIARIAVLEAELR